MKIVDTLVTKFVEKVLQDMESLSEELEVKKDLKPIDSAKQGMDNDKIYKKLLTRQSLLQILRTF